MEETTESVSIIHYLPEDVLRHIFIHLDDIDLKSTSLVCKLLCYISSPLVRKLTLENSSLTSSHFQRLFKRFSGTKNICIYDFSYLGSVLSAIFNSDLNLEKLHLRLKNPLYPFYQTIDKMSTSRVIKGIKSLKLDLFNLPKQHTVEEFVNQLPLLTELDFSRSFYHWDDKGIHKVTSKLPNLRKIDLRSNRMLTDKTLDILSSNCPKLESVNFVECMKFTPEALYKFFCNNPQLSSASVDWPPSISKVVECVQVLKNLNSLSLFGNHLNDTVLIGLAESRPPIKNLVISNAFDINYTMTGLSQSLSACPGLENLDINTPLFENCNTHDAELSIVVKRLPNLKHITIWSRFVCRATLFSLIQNCPLIETISLDRLSFLRRIKKVYCDQGMSIPTKKNHNIKSIMIYPKSDIWLLSAVESYCPNLRK
ncbi:hypothetical protein QQ045_016984 [Rhodiola kirilowii]